jgi:hypothetical protein
MKNNNKGKSKVALPMPLSRQTRAALTVDKGGTPPGRPPSLQASPLPSASGLLKEARGAAPESERTSLERSVLIATDQVSLKEIERPQASTGIASIMRSGSATLMPGTYGTPRRDSPISVQGNAHASSSRVCPEESTGPMTSQDEARDVNMAIEASLRPAMAKTPLRNSVSSSSSRRTSQPRIPIPVPEGVVPPFAIRPARTPESDRCSQISVATDEIATRPNSRTHLTMQQLPSNLTSRHSSQREPRTLAQAELELAAAKAQLAYYQARSSQASTRPSSSSTSSWSERVPIVKEPEMTRRVRTKERLSCHFR